MSEERPQPQPQEEPNQQPEPTQPDLPIQQPEQPEPRPATQPESEPARDWRDRRIGEQQQRLRERNARIQELEAQLQQLSGQAPQPQGQPGQGQQYGQPPSPYGQGDIQRQINEAAAQMAATQEFTRRCNEVAEAGRRSYGNFDQRVQRLTGLVDANDTQQVRQYNDFLSACMETGQASRLIYELGGDLNEASRIMAMTPVKMAVELTRMSSRPGTESSNAPRPLAPVASSAQSNRALIHPDDPEGADTLSIEEWMRRREEQIATRRQRTLG